MVGASGYLGSEVCRLAPATGPSSAVLDIRDRAAVLSYVSRARPQLIVNAAYRVHDWASCADGAANVALAAREVNARLVHVSTDALHAGRPTPYLDADTPTPVHTYGAAKAAAETAVAAIDPAAVLVRTSLIIGDDRSHQVKLALDLTTGRRPGKLFTDEIRCPVHVTDLAGAILELAATDYAGLINVAGPEAITRADLGRLIATSHGLNPADVPTCPLAEGGLGPRPADVRLDSTRAAVLLKSRLRPVSDAVA